jgi:RecA/RadA recombinase
MEPYANVGNIGKFIKFHCKELNMDNFFVDGINNQQAIEIVGESGTGKSSFCIFLAINFLLTHKNRTVLYISINKPVSQKRIDQIIQYHSENVGYNSQDLLERLVTHNIRFEEYCDMSKDFLNIINKEKVGMIVLDTITSIMQEENFKGDKSYGAKINFLNNQFKMFRKLMSEYDIFVFLINDVRTDLSTGVNNIKIDYESLSRSEI